MTRTLGELCAGYGGLGLAVEQVFNANAAWFSEFDAAPSKILAHHWPHVPNYGDMTAINWAEIEHVDIISGGTPCQDLSNAGKRAGMNEGTRSNLWAQMREAIAIQRPEWVVWENVRGAFSACASSEMGQCPGCLDGRKPHEPVLRAIGRVLGDLSDLGYDCQWRGLRAADVGGCHPRFRVFVLARKRAIPHGNDAGRGEQRGSVDFQKEHTATECTGSNAAHADGIRIQRDRPTRHRRDESKDGDKFHSTPGGTSAWGEYEPAIRRWERVIGRPAPRATLPTGRDGKHQLSARFTEWMMGLPDGWVTDPEIGITRNQQLKACGNGVVPQQARAALRDMLAAFQGGEYKALQKSSAQQAVHNQGREGLLSGTH